MMGEDLYTNGLLSKDGSRSLQADDEGDADRGGTIKVFGCKRPRLKGVESLDSGYDDSTGNFEENRGLSDRELTQWSILAIDDDEATLGLLEDLLSLSGFRVFTAGEGQQGIERFSEERPDLVITDIQMPGMDGLELLQRVRSVDDLVPVILVTGHGDLDNAVRALRRGAHDFLLKPINADILLNTVRKGLEHSRLLRLEKHYRRVLEDRVAERTRELAERTDELARTNEFMRGIINSSTRVAIVLTDFEHKVTFWNTGAESIYGYSADEMLGESILRLYPVDEVTLETVNKLGQLMQSEAGTVQESIKQVAKDGSTLTVSMAVSPMRDASGRVRGILGLGQDVTKEVKLHEELLESYRRIQKIQGASIFAIAKLAESRDGETAFHLERLQQYCRALCNRLTFRDQYSQFMTTEFVEDLVQCSLLHDIGKVAIPDSILFNTRKFGIDEYEIMKQHTIHGGRALEEAAERAGEPESFLTMGKDVAYYHHERWDGKGYPFGLTGEQIPLAARIVAIADVYDALTTERRYKRAYSHVEAREVIVAEKGKQFDPGLVEAFLEAEGEFREIRDMFRSAIASQENGHSEIRSA